MIRSFSLLCTTVFIATLLPSFVASHKPLLVGKTRDLQCKDLGYRFACKGRVQGDEDNSCVFLVCGREHGNKEYFRQRVYPYTGVQDGTSCGVSKMCINRQCVERVEPKLRIKGNRVVRRCGADLALKPETRLEQCKRHGFNVVCKALVHSCTRIICGYARPNLAYYVLHPHHGLSISVAINTQCGESKICKGRTCVAVPPDEMPNYSSPEEFKDCQSLPETEPTCSKP